MADARTAADAVDKNLLFLKSNPLLFD